MRQNLLETYSRQLKVAEAYVAKNFEGKTMSSNTALTTAVLLDNTNRWMTEALDTSLSGATSRGDMGAWKKFCLNLTNIAVPSLIANDIVIVHPMTSYSGSVAYLKYVALSDKNGMQGKTLNSVFGLGDPDVSEATRSAYTSQVIVETVSGGKLTLTPFAAGRFEGGKDIKVIRGEETLYFAVADYTPVDGDKVAYVSAEFQMEQVPAANIPTIGPKMEHIPLVAEPRRIAVRYDQITAFQA